MRAGSQSYGTLKRLPRLNLKIKNLHTMVRKKVTLLKRVEIGYKPHLNYKSKVKGVPT
jgi:hypothetical protein